MTNALASAASKAAIKTLYEIGEIPPLGHVPENMYAWVVRKERHGPPEDSMQIEVVPTWTLDSHDVLVFVMAAGVNYNGVWAALGEPISPIDAVSSSVAEATVPTLLEAWLEAVAAAAACRAVSSLLPRIDAEMDCIDPAATATA